MSIQRPLGRPSETKLFGQIIQNGSENVDGIRNRKSAAGRWKMDIAVMVGFLPEETGRNRGFFPEESGRNSFFLQKT